MKRSGPPKRSELARGPGPARKPMKHRRKPDPPALVAGKAAVRERSQGRCEARTPVCDLYARHVHHRLMRSQGGGHGLENLLDVCHCCHDWIHDNPAESYERGWLVRAGAAASVVNTKGNR